MRATLVFAWILITGCGSTPEPYTMPDTDEGLARPEAYHSESMYFSKPMPDRRDAKPWEFYYKHCSMNGKESHYSKTSYNCSGPYY